MSPDADEVLAVLREACRGLSLRQLALDLRWSTPGAEAPWSTGLTGCRALDTHRVFKAVSELRSAHFVEERISASGSRWAVVR